MNFIALRRFEALKKPDSALLALSLVTSTTLFSCKPVAQSNLPSAKPENIQAEIEALPNADFPGFPHRNPNESFLLEKSIYKLKDIQETGILVGTFVGPPIPECPTCYNMPSGNLDGEATAARFYHPWGIALGPNGNLVVADRYNNLIRTIATTGVVSTLAGSREDYGLEDGVGANALLEKPDGVAVDKQGNVYVAEGINAAIRKISPSGEVTTLAGGVKNPNGGENGIEFGFVDGVGQAARFFRPTGIAVSDSGDIYVADSANNAIRRITPGGSVTTVAGNPNYDEEGNPQGDYNDGPASTARFNYPTDIAIDRQGNLIVADYRNQRIRKIDRQGIVSTVAGTGDRGFADGAGSIAMFRFPVSVAVDECNNIFIADEQNSRVRKIDTTGTVSTISGGNAEIRDGDSSIASIISPEGIEVDRNNNVYVSEFYGNRVRKISLGAHGCTPGAAILGEESKAFSPNGDGTKDTYAIAITAEGAWELEVEGYPGLINTGSGPNSGNKTFQWDGKVDKHKLKDGKYKVNLKQSNFENFIEITIDTKAPIIQDSKVANIESDIIDRAQNYNPETRYTFSISLKNESELTSAIDLQSVVGEFTGGSLQTKGIALKTSTNELKTIQKVLSKDVSAENLSYRFKLSDVAGNTCEFLPKNAENFSAKVDLLDFNSELAENSEPSNSYRQLLAVTGKTKFLKNIYYDQCGYPLHVQGTVRINNGTVGFPGQVPIVLENKATKTPYKVTTCHFISGVRTNHSILWNGRDLATGDPAPEGRYRIFMDDSQTPGIHDHRDTEFLVSNKVCVKFADWVVPGAPAAYADPKQGAHILDGHVMPGGMTPRGGARPPEDWFGMFDATLSLQRPYVRNPVSPNVPILYDELNFVRPLDSTQNYLETSALMTSSAFKRVMRIADAVKKIGEMPPNDPSARYAPVVLTGKKILWVRVIQRPNSTSVHTVYPYQRSAGNQNEYESELKNQYP